MCEVVCGGVGGVGGSGVRAISGLPLKFTIWRFNIERLVARTRKSIQVNKTDYFFKCRC